MTLTVLTDSEVKGLLEGFKRPEIEELQMAMRNALHEYSTSNSVSGAAAGSQPNRTVIESTNGTTTLFMPSTSSFGLGMKGKSHLMLLADRC